MNLDFFVKKQFPAKHHDVLNRILVIIEAELDQEEQFDFADDYLAAASK
jgi:hypothetical protein